MSKADERTAATSRPSRLLSSDASRVEMETSDLDDELHFADAATAIAEKPSKRSMEDRDLRPTLVRASAGTGKTYRLTARLLKILLQGAAPESILATTFTRKAAGEILDRVLLSLARAADENDDEALEALRAQVEIPTLPRSVCLQLLDTLLRNVHRLRVCTLDSLFAQLARSFPFELGLPPAWRLTDEIEEMWMRERAVDAVIAMLDRSEMGSVLSMLGKGEIKRSIARELLQVVDAAYSSQRGCGEDVWHQLAVPKQPEAEDLATAAGNMRLVKPKQKRLQTKLKSLSETIDLNQFAALVGDTVIGNIAKARRSRQPVQYYSSNFPPELDPSFDVLYKAVQSHVLSLLQHQNEATGAVLKAYQEHIEAIKTSSRALGFEDVSVKLASEFAVIDHRHIQSRMDGAIDHVLLDEFQDTSPAQWQVLRPIVARVAAAEADDQRSDSDQWQVDRSFFCVGDTKQAIYGWRGGVAEIFDAVADQIDGVDEVEQNTSYRSSPVVIGAVNDTFRNLHRHPTAEHASSGDPTDKAMYESSAMVRFARRFPLHDANKSELPGHVRLMTARRIDDGDNEARRLACYEDAAAIAAELTNQNPSKSVGVLMRTNHGVAQMIFLLERLGVEVSQEGGNPLTDSASVEMILSALMMADHPGDGRWEFHVMGSPLAQIENMSPDWVRTLAEDRGIAETVQVLADALAPHCDARETLRLKQLTQLAIDYQRNPSPRLRDFVRLVREKRVERPQAAPVRVMTIHQSKGLEFDSVILAEIDGQLTRQSGHCVADVKDLGSPPQAMTRYLNQKSWHFLPERWQRAFGKQADASTTEALCLLYVAMTRARQGLYMVMQPAKKAKFDNRTAASLIYHALACEDDPTQGEITLYESGDPNWCLDGSEASEVTSKPIPEEIKRVQIQLQPLPPVPRRNRTPRR